VKTVIVGVTGSVAAYRAADICRELMRRGFEVRVCLTRSAAQFVTASLFEALTGGPVLTDVFDEPIAGRMAHIDWAREAACILVCPATANAIATLAAGEADDMFSTIVSASGAPLVIAPAMNPDMYASQSNGANMQLMASRGALFVEPDEGDVACGEQGQGKLASSERIVAAVEDASQRSAALAGKVVVITSGPTREPLDPVRFLTNRSSGKMGVALARAALQMGASVKLVTGPTAEIGPPRAEVVRVETADEMLHATLAACEGADLAIGAAAVADFRPVATEDQKRKGKEPWALSLVPNADILAEARKRFPELPIIAFAAETEKHEDHARAKMQAKGVQGIVMNDVSGPHVGFDSSVNAGVLLLADGRRVVLPQESKFRFALRVLEAVAEDL
jgi:phosphopantothenoylcysteine decarboxylase/phosphopantothenate--cysteine ligase